MAVVVDSANYGDSPTAALIKNAQQFFVESDKKKKKRERERGDNENLPSNFAHQTQINEYIEKHLSL